MKYLDNNGLAKVIEKLRNEIKANSNEKIIIGKAFSSLGDGQVKTMQELTDAFFGDATHTPQELIDTLKRIWNEGIPAYFQNNDTLVHRNYPVTVMHLNPTKYYFIYFDGNSGSIRNIYISYLSADATATTTISKKTMDIRVNDNLTSTSTTTPLSANQGKVLNDKIEAMKPVNSLISDSTEASLAAAAGKTLNDKIDELNEKNGNLETHFLSNDFISLNSDERESKKITKTVKEWVDIWYGDNTHTYQEFINELEKLRQGEIKLFYRVSNTGTTNSTSYLKEISYKVTYSKIGNWKYMVTFTILGENDYLYTNNITFTASAVETANVTLRASCNRLKKQIRVYNALNEETYPQYGMSISDRKNLYNDTFGFIIKDMHISNNSSLVYNYGKRILAVRLVTNGTYYFSSSYIKTNAINPFVVANCNNNFTSFFRTISVKANSDNTSYEVYTNQSGYLLFEFSSDEEIEQFTINGTGHITTLREKTDEFVTMTIDSNSFTHHTLTDLKVSSNEPTEGQVWIKKGKGTNNNLFDKNKIINNAYMGNSTTVTRNTDRFCFNITLEAGNIYYITSKYAAPQSFSFRTKGSTASFTNTSTVNSTIILTTSREYYLNFTKDTTHTLEEQLEGITITKNMNSEYYNEDTELFLTDEAGKFYSVGKLNNSEITVSDMEPEEKSKIWLRYSPNIINKNNIFVENNIVLMNDSGMHALYKDDSYTDGMFYFKCKPNQTYTICYNSSSSDAFLIFGLYNSFNDKGYNLTINNTAPSSNYVSNFITTFTTTEDCKFLGIRYTHIKTKEQIIKDFAIYEGDKTEDNNYYSSVERDLYILDKNNNYIPLNIFNEDKVSLSMTTPENGKDIWIRPIGENIFNYKKNKVLRANLSTDGDNYKISNSNYAILIMKCEPNTSYNFICKESLDNSHIKIATTSTEPLNYNETAIKLTPTLKSMSVIGVQASRICYSITTGENAQYLLIQYCQVQNAMDYNFYLPLENTATTYNIPESIKRKGIIITEGERPNYFYDEESNIFIRNKNNEFESLNFATKDYVDNQITNNSGKTQVFSWDGQSSSSNSANLALWQEIYNASREDSVVVVPTYSNSNNRGNLIFGVNSYTLKPNTSNSIRTPLVSIGFQGGQTTGNYNVFYYYYVTVQVDSNGNVTSVGSMSSSSVSTDSFLSTRANPGANEFVPTLDYHPATKKYVDDKVSPIDFNKVYELSWATNESDTSKNGYIMPIEGLTSLEQIRDKRIPFIAKVMGNYVGTSYGLSLTSTPQGSTGTTATLYAPIDSESITLSTPGKVNYITFTNKNGTDCFVIDNDRKDLTLSLYFMTSTTTSYTTIDSVLTNLGIGTELELAAFLNALEYRPIPVTFKGRLSTSDGYGSFNGSISGTVARASGKIRKMELTMYAHTKIYNALVTVNTSDSTVTVERKVIDLAELAGVLGGSY